MFDATSTPGRSRILDAARRLVRGQGYAVVSLRQIAAEAAYSPAGLYAHFPGREGILEALAEEVRGELGWVLERAAAGETEPLARLVAIGLAYISFALEHPAEFELLFRFTRSRKQNLEDPSPSSFDLLRRIARAAAPGSSAKQIDLACLALWATVHGLANLRAFHLPESACDWDAWSRSILRQEAERLLCGAK